MNTKPEIVVNTYQGKTESVVRWGRKYALTHLASEGGQVRPAGERMFLTQAEILRHPRSLVIGERSGGGRSFVEWLITELDKDDERWVCVRGYSWEPGHFRLSKAVEGRDQQIIKKREAEQAKGEVVPEEKAPEKGPKTVREILKDFAEGTSAARSQHLIQWARSLKKPVHLLIRDLGGLGEGSAEEAAVALRLFGEASEQEPEIRDMLRLLLVSTSEDRFEDRYDASGFAIMCERYRLPWLAEPEVAALAADSGFARTHEGEPFQLGDEAMDEIMVSIGGQPLLVQKVLAHLCRVGSPEVSKKDIKGSYRHFRDRPPEAVRWWQEDLRVRLKESPGLSEALRDYVAGKSRGAKEGLPRLEHSLMYSGWIRFDRSIERWKISSKIHRYLAHGVLSEGARR